MIRWHIFFLAISSSAFSQRLVEGSIVDKETKKSVPFASIGIVGTSKGTSSNFDGQFSISINEKDSVKISCVGYESLTLSSVQVLPIIDLVPIVTQLSEIVILDRAINAKKILRKAFANIDINYNDRPFLQQFFYRHYCKDGTAYGRLIEAAVDVWKMSGYQSFQHAAGEKEEIRVTQLRRSLDKTEVAQGHEPISVGNILQADIVGYQTDKKSERMSFYTDVSNLRTDFEKYDFVCRGITYYDGLEVYEITYQNRKDSVLTTSGKYLSLVDITGTLFITTGGYAFVRTEENKAYGTNTLHTSTFYRKVNDHYYPYHFTRQGESEYANKRVHSVHLELMSMDIKTNPSVNIVGQLPTREGLLNIRYDSMFWENNAILKTTPLEDDIIRGLGGGASLDKQFLKYHQFEMNTQEGSINGEEKLNWLLADSKGNRMLYLLFWKGNLQSYLVDVELAKRLQKKYRNKVTFVFLSLEDEEKKWREIVEKFSLYADGIINYRIGTHSKIAASLSIEEAPSFILLTRDGEMVRPTKRPSNPSLEGDLENLIGQH
ncbi:MAG: carboxypeptidase-like regulatory domain-containing protein [Cyclobacteriaceae bacterium]|nr:carboxypeptidase-like regulatory domain-containing protein [Cyclobacteriaceae bacterium]